MQHVTSIFKKTTVNKANLQTTLQDSTLLLNALWQWLKNYYFSDSGYHQVALLCLFCDSGAILKFWDVQSLLI